MTSLIGQYVAGSYVSMTTIPVWHFRGWGDTLNCHILTNFPIICYTAALQIAKPFPLNPWLSKAPTFRPPASRLMKMSMEHNLTGSSSCEATSMADSISSQDSSRALLSSRCGRVSQSHISSFQVFCYVFFFCVTLLSCVQYCTSILRLRPHHISYREHRIVHRIG